MSYRTLLKSVSAGALLALAAGTAAQAQTILTTSNGIVRSSLCVGTDCQSGISFSDSTIIVKENNTRIKFADTSTINSFPRNDWELEANSQTNGGLNRFSIFDCGEGSNNGGCGGSNVFSVEAGAGNNALYVDDGGRVGLGTGSPVVELHVVDGDTPTLRLEQNTSAGFAAQTYDVAGNEANFFVRDVTNGSLLPFRSRPGAPTSSIDIAANGDVGMGIASPEGALHVFDNAGSGLDIMLKLENNGDPGLEFENTGNGNVWVQRAGQSLIMDHSNDGTFELILASNGNLTITGTLTTTGSCSIGCDRVFEDGYEIMPIAERADLMWAQGYLPNVGPTPEDAPFNVTDKMGRMLNELEHAHIYIDQLNTELKAQAAQNADLMARLELLEAKLAE